MRRILTTFQQFIGAGAARLAPLPPLIVSLFSAATFAAELSFAPSVAIEDQGYGRVFEIVEEALNSSSQEDKQSLPFVRTLKAVNAPSVPRRLVLYEKGRPRNPSTRRVLTQKVLVQLSPQTGPTSLRQASVLKSIKALDYAPDYFLCEAIDQRDVFKLSSELRRMPGVLLAEPLLGKQEFAKALPNDPLLTNQWYLLNSPQSGRIGINVSNVWSRLRGRGITIAVVDDGVQLTHPDLASNVLTNIGFDFRDNDNDPSPDGNEDYHGTAVAGIIAARGGNSAGIAGVAFEASLLAVRLIGGEEQTDDQNAAAALYEHPIVHVNNSSWGPQDDGQTLEAPGRLMSLALEKAVRDGRNGKGTIFVWPAGNGRPRQDDANYDGYANSIYTIAVAATDYDGRQGAYSEPGACIVVSAPSHGEVAADENRIVTTDLTGDLGLNKSSVPGDLADVNYTRYFGGSSAATALASGAVALILEANPSLGWRDVQEILIRSAAKTDPTDSDWMTNSVGLRFNHKYGAGLINTEAAVRLATNWMNLGPQANIFLVQSNLLESIPDNAAASVIRTFDFSKARSLRVEHVVVTVSIAHSRRGDLAVTLVSPTGTRSRLAERHPDTNVDYINWKFMSVFNWGEHSQGRWEVHVSDQRSNHGGTLNAVRIDLFGSDAPQQARPVLTAIGIEADKFGLRLAGIPGRLYELQGSTNLTNWTRLEVRTISSPDGAETLKLEAGNLRFRFYRALEVP